MKQWQIGDRAIYTYPGSAAKGLEVVILSELHSQKVDGTFILAHSFDPGIQNPGYCGWAAEPEYFKPIPDDEAKKKTKWDEIVDANNNCIFTPRELVTV